MESPRGADVRPTPERVREALMSILGSRVVGARVADLFAGSGALGLEALSRGAAHATFVERSARAIRAIRGNARRLGAGADATVVRGDALAHARRLRSRPYDIVFADPPYGRGGAEAVLAVYRRRPFARELWLEHRAGELANDDGALEQRVYGDVGLSRAVERPERGG